jgi:hypothetical protein
MLDDLLLLESGRIVFSGSLGDAVMYFRSVGFDNPRSINPADYYLELAQQSPDASNESVTWKTLFESSPFATRYEQAMAEAISAAVAKPSPPSPSSMVRFGYIFSHLMRYFFAEKGLYFNRLLSLVVLAVFLGSLYLNLTATTDNIVNYVGTMFFAAISVMLTAVSSTAIFAKDRREAVDKVANGVFTPAVFVCAQFLASAVYSFLVSFVFSW